MSEHVKSNRELAEEELLRSVGLKGDELSIALCRAQIRSTLASAAAQERSAEAMEAYRLTLEAAMPQLLGDLEPTVPAVLVPTEGKKP